MTERRARLSDPVSLRPTAFSDDLPDLSQLSLEDVVARFKDTEKRRRLDTEPENESEVRWRVRSAPCELLSSLRIVSGNLGVSTAILTKCMSHQLADWYANSLGLDRLSVEYHEVFRLIKAQTYSTLRWQAEHPAEFKFVGSVDVARTSVSTIKWVVARLSAVQDVVGVSVHNLFMMGLMWSLTTVAHREWDGNTVSRFFAPEVFNFETFVADRKVDVAALRMKFDNREKAHYNDHIFIGEGGQNYES